MADDDIQHVFVYGNLRPDAGGHESLALRDASSSSKKAWLLGGRLFCVSGKRAAVRLEEPGNAVKGFVLAARDPRGIESLLLKCDASAEHRGFDRDAVEVVTEAGERVAAFVYHCPQIDRSKPVGGGDWMSYSGRL